MRTTPPDPSRHARLHRNRLPAGPTATSLSASSSSSLSSAASSSSVRPAYPVQSSFSFPPIAARPVDTDRSSVPATAHAAAAAAAAAAAPIHRGILRDALIYAAFSVVECLCEAHGIPYGAQLRPFITAVVRCSRTTSSILRLALYYLIRARDSLATLKTKIPSGRRLFLAALILAFKYLHDKTFSTRGWSKIADCSVSEINSYEISLLDTLGWRLHVPLDTFDKWDRFLANFQPVLVRCIKLRDADAAHPYIADWHAAVLTVQPELAIVPQPSLSAVVAVPSMLTGPTSPMSVTPSLPSSPPVYVMPPTPIGRLARLSRLPATGSLSCRIESESGLPPTPMSACQMVGMPLPMPVPSLGMSMSMPTSMPVRPRDPSTEPEIYSDPASVTTGCRSNASWEMSPHSPVFDQNPAMLSSSSSTSSGSSMSACSATSSASSCDFAYLRHDQNWADSNYPQPVAGMGEKDQVEPVICAALSSTPEMYAADGVVGAAMLSAAKHDRASFPPVYERRKRRRSSAGDGRRAPSVPWSNLPYTPGATHGSDGPYGGHVLPLPLPLPRSAVNGGNGHSMSVPGPRIQGLQRSCGWHSVSGSRGFGQPVHPGRLNGRQMAPPMMVQSQSANSFALPRYCGDYRIEPERIIDRSSYPVLVAPAADM